MSLRPKSAPRPSPVGCGPYAPLEVGIKLNHEDMIQSAVVFKFDDISDLADDPTKKFFFSTARGAHSRYMKRRDSLAIRFRENGKLGKVDYVKVNAEDWSSQETAGKFYFHLQVDGRKAPIAVYCMQPYDTRVPTFEARRLTSGNVREDIVVVDDGLLKAALLAGTTYWVRGDFPEAWQAPVRLF